MSSVVLDASALLALMQHEPGWERVDAVLGSSVISSVNYSETITKLIERGMLEADVRQALDLIQCEVMEFTESDAWEAARLRAETRAFGLSLGDRACLALARRLDATALTTDRAWKEVAFLARIELLR